MAGFRGISREAQTAGEIEVRVLFLLAGVWADATRRGTDRRTAGQGGDETQGEIAHI